MPTHTLSPCLIALLLAATVFKKLDCTGMNLSIVPVNVPERAEEVTDLYLENFNEQYVLQVTTAERLLPVEIRSVHAEYFRFEVKADNSSTPPLLSLCPTVPLYPIDNLPANTLQVQVPLYGTYVCTEEETHKLLQAYVRDIPEAVIKNWPVLLKMSARTCWPDLEDLANTLLKVKWTAFSPLNPTDFRLIIEQTTSGASTSAPNLYELRNHVLAYTLLPSILKMGWHVAQLPLWNNSTRTICTGTLPTDPLALLCHTLLATAANRSVELRPSLTASQVHQKLRQHQFVRLQDLFPSIAEQLPTASEPPSSTPLQILQNIQDHMLQLQREAFLT